MTYYEHAPPFQRVAHPCRVQKLTPRAKLADPSRPLQRAAVITKSMDALVWLRKQLETGDNDLLRARWCGALLRG